MCVRSSNSFTLGAKWLKWLFQLNIAIVFGLLWLSMMPSGTLLISTDTRIPALWVLRFLWDSISVKRGSTDASSLALYLFFYPSLLLNVISCRLIDLSVGFLDHFPLWSVVIMLTFDSAVPRHPLPDLTDAHLSLRCVKHSPISSPNGKYGTVFESNVDVNERAREREKRGCSGWCLVMLMHTISRPSPSVWVCYPLWFDFTCIILNL